MNNNSNSTLATRFIDEFFRLLERGDAVSLGKLLKIENPAYRNVYFKEDAMNYLMSRLKNSSDEVVNWAEVIEYYVLARNSLLNDDYLNAFDYLTKSFKNLIDLINDAKDENWQLPVLFVMSVDLRLLAYTCDTKKQQNQQLFLSSSRSSASANAASNKDGESGANQADEYAEKTAECLILCFRNLCTDTRADSSVSKRWGMMVYALAQ